MKTLILILLCSTACLAQPSKKYKADFDKAYKAFDSTIVKLGFNHVEITQVQKQWKMIDSINAKISERWLYKLEAKGYRREDIIDELPTGRRDSVKLILKNR